MTLSGLDGRQVPALPWPAPVVFDGLRPGAPRLPQVRVLPMISRPGPERPEPEHVAPPAGPGTAESGTAESETADPETTRPATTGTGAAQQRIDDDRECAAVPADAPGESWPDRGTGLVADRITTLPRPAGPRTAPALQRPPTVAAAERLFRTTMSHSPVGMALTTTDGRIVQVNDQLCRILGRDAGELVGHTLGEVTHPDDAVAEAPLLERLVEGGTGGYEVEKRFVVPREGTVWTRQTVAAVADLDRAGPGLVVQVLDVTETRMAQERLTHHALHDRLTGLPNRTLAVDCIQQALDDAGAAGSRVAVLCCDLHRLKVINDGIGRRGGDTVLLETARRIRRVLEPRHLLARMDSDEFLVLIENAPDDDRLTELADRILAETRRPVEVGNRRMSAPLTIGIATAAPGTTEATTLVRDAYAALTEARTTRATGDWALVDNELRRRTEERLDVENSLRAALANGELTLRFQPIVELATGRTVGREALLRWDHPRRGLLSPVDFLDVAEESGVISEIGRWVLAEAAAATVRRDDDSYVAVNVSAHQLARPGLAGEVRRILAVTGLAPSRLVIELTESVMLSAAPAGRDEIGHLDALGVRVVVDDFGTGFSALSYLRDLPVSGIKVDRSFTAGLGTNPQCDRIVEALTGLAGGLGVDLVAEGVETDEQRRLLLQIGCVHAQGFLFGRPEPAPATSPR